MFLVSTERCSKHINITRTTDPILKVNNSGNCSGNVQKVMFEIFSLYIENFSDHELDDKT